MMLNTSELQKQIGQMLMLGFTETQVVSNSDIIQAIQKNHIGQLILYEHNIQNTVQLTSLTQNLKQSAPHSLWLAIDHEGGQVNRLKPHHGFASFPSAQALGEANDLQLTFEWSEQIAILLKSLGIDLNLAPVVDLNTNPSNPIISMKHRSYSSNPEIVYQQASEFIKAHHLHQIMTALKHFPGHGSSQQDSHLGFVNVSETWHENELIPYQKLIMSNICPMIMTAHIFNRQLDAEYPATLSQKIIHDLLRNKLKYDGVIISDDLQMKAISHHYGMEQAIFLAIQAGVDILLFSNQYPYDPNLAEIISQIIQKLVQNKAISPTRIKNSYDKILQLKKSYVV